MNGPSAGTEAFPASHIEYILGLSCLVRSCVYFVFNVLHGVRYVGLLRPTRV